MLKPAASQKTEVEMGRKKRKKKKIKKKKIPVFWDTCMYLGQTAVRGSNSSSLL
jgi:hypothetical protein